MVVVNHVEHFPHRMLYGARRFIKSFRLLPRTTMLTSSRTGCKKVSQCSRGSKIFRKLYYLRTDARTWPWYNIKWTAIRYKRRITTFNGHSNHYHVITLCMIGSVFPLLWWYKWLAKDASIQISHHRWSVASFCLGSHSLRQNFILVSN